MQRLSGLLYRWLLGAGVAVGVWNAVLASESRVSPRVVSRPATITLACACPPAPKFSTPKPVLSDARPTIPRWQMPEQTGVLEAVGVAPYPANATSRAQARAQARRAAILDAQRQLVEQLHGVHISSESVLTEHGLREQMHASAQGMLRGAQVVSERDLGDAYEVVMRWSPPSYGQVVQPLPTRDTPHQPTMPTPAPAWGYTGVIIDARGLGLQPSIAPRIRDPYGNTLWGNLEIDPAVAIEYGVAGWARTEAELSHPSLQARVGTRPLRLRAVRVQGAAHNEVILSHEDAERLLQANALSGFLERLAVVFLY